MSYQVLYQKYRPKNLEQLCGQEHITQTLRNSIKNNRVANAYLFTGIHGTGKTSTARVLACMLNCENGPTDQPCGTCMNCLKIHAGKAADVIEVDAASNRGIDNMRSLRDKARYAPSEMNHKVFIIDEAHQLTTEASNALLKILEEPPANLHFCLCTTEPRAIIGTIKSRCQHFAVKSIPQKKMFQHLVPIVKEEDISVGRDALKMIVKIADGSMRNALRSLESVWNFSGEDEITTEAVSNVLGVADTKKAYELTDCIVRKKISEGVKLINDLAVNGVDLTAFLLDLTNHFRDLVILGSSENESLLDASEEEAALLREQIRGIHPGQAIKIFEFFEAAYKGADINLPIQNVLEVCFLRAVYFFHRES